MKNKSNDRLVSRKQDDRFNADVKLAEHLHVDILLWTWLFNAISRPTCTHFTRRLIRKYLYDLTHTILYDLSGPQWRVSLGVG